MTQLAKILRAHSLILLDFDGPVCAIFGTSGAAQAANALRNFAAARGLSATTYNGSDPLELLRLIILESPAQAAQADQHLRRLERTAAMQAIPTPGCAEFVDAVSRTGRQIAIVSNNDAEAIETYLRRNDLARLIATIRGRPAGQLQRMKPDPWLLVQAASDLGYDLSEAIMIGDSTNDVHAASSVGVPCIGYANKPGKKRHLAEAGASAVVTSMTQLRTAAVRLQPTGRSVGERERRRAREIRSDS